MCLQQDSPRPFRNLLTPLCSVSGSSSRYWSTLCSNNPANGTEPEMKKEKEQNNLILQEVTITCSAKEQSDVVRKQLETPSELSATRDQCYCSSLSCYTLYTCILCYWNVYKHGHKWPSENAASTFSPVLPQLPILNETSKHLRLHEDTQETTDAFRRHGFTEGLSLKNALSALILSDKQGVMSDGLQEEADESLWHQAVQGVVLCQDKGKGINGKSETEKSQIFSSLFLKSRMFQCCFAAMSVKEQLTFWKTLNWALVTHCDELAQKDVRVLQRLGLNKSNELINSLVRSDDVHSPSSDSLSESWLMMSFLCSSACSRAAWSFRGNSEASSSIYKQPKTLQSVINNNVWRIRFKGSDFQQRTSCLQPV